MRSSFPAGVWFVALVLLLLASCSRSDPQEQSWAADPPLPRFEGSVDDQAAVVAYTKSRFEDRSIERCLDPMVEASPDSRLPQSVVVDRVEPRRTVNGWVLAVRLVGRQGEYFVRYDQSMLLARQVSYSVISP